MSIEPTLHRHVLSGATMGTRYSATFHAAADLPTEALAVALFEAVDRVDRQMSTWKPESDLTRLNAAAIGVWTAIPRDLGRVLTEARRIGRISGGAFDIGVGDLVAAWGFGAAACAPDGARIRVLAATARPNARHMLEISPSGLEARRTGPVTLDLSGIAKGFGVDELARVMERFDIASWLVGIDGEMRAKGEKPDGTPWGIALERPEQGLRAAAGVITLTDKAIATSGTYRHRAEHNGRTVSHTMAPKTGAPLENRLTSVTVLAPTCMEADAFATALMVLGEDAGPKLAQVLGLGAIFIREDGTTLSNL